MQFWQNYNWIYCNPNTFEAILQYRSKVTWQPLETRDSTIASLVSRVESVMSLQLDCSYEELIRQTTRRFCVPFRLFHWRGWLLRDQVWYAHIRVSHFAKILTRNTALFLVLCLNLCSAFPLHRLNLRKAGDNWAAAACFPIQASFSLDCDRHCK